VATFPAGGKQVSDQTPYENIELQGDPADQIIIGFERGLGALDAEQRRITIDTAINRLSEDFGPRLLPEPFIAAPPERKDVFFAVTLIRLRPDRTLEELQAEIRKGTYEGVGWAEPNASVTPASFNDPLSSVQWALDVLGATEPWTVSPPGPATILGIVDSGLRRPGGGLHSDLGLVEPVAVCQPPFFFTNNIDRIGHGTFLAGTMAAVPNYTGIASPIDPGWNIRLLPVQFFSPRVPPNALYAAIGIVWAALRPAKVINASWHVASNGGLVTLRNAIVFANAFDCLIVFAAGNDGTDNEIYPIYPANFGNDPAFAGNVLTVAASDRYDAKAYFSNYGRNTVHIAAPGMRILTTAPYLDGTPRYIEYSGTSAAAAYVSAGAALVFALNPAWSSQDVVRHLLASAVSSKNLMLTCINGKRLSLKRAVYGPLTLTAPLAGASLPVNLPATVTWTLDPNYNNPGLAQVNITFTEQAGPVHLLGTVGIGAGFASWTPTSPPLPPPPVIGRITITPTTGNFPMKIEPVTITP